jgi:DNA polymerase-3 subunit delta'
LYIVPLGDFEPQFPRICQCLRQARRNGRIGQAYLFVGDNPALLEGFVNAFAQTCACAEPDDQGEPCGTCRACKLFKADSYPEKYVVTPQSKSRQIRIDDIRDLEHQLGLATGPRMMKFGVIAEADCMGEEAQNAFLKTLEEPGPNTMLLLFTAQPKLLLPTIRSRCQTLSLMTNRRDYQLARDLDVFKHLARLNPNEGAAVGLDVSAKLQDIFATLHKQAETYVTENRSHDWDEIAEDDQVLKKKLDEEFAARIEAEYLRRREHVEDAILTWFLQQMIAAAGVPNDQLPQSDIVQDTPSENGTSNDALDHAEKNIRLAEELIRCMHANVPEPLALDAFCLSVTEKPRPPKKNRTRA